MNKAFRYLAVIFLGLFLGGVSALWMTGLIGRSSLASFANVNVNSWMSDWSIGSSSANAYTRARVARHGLLALAKEEAVYFTRSVDDDGAPLQETCVYELKGGQQDALWWSITLYDGESRLPMNDDGALSIDATSVGAAEQWRALISSKEPENEFWLSSRNAGHFDLTLRLYGPAKDMITTPISALNAPEIKKISCENGAL